MIKRYKTFVFQQTFSVFLMNPLEIHVIISLNLFDIQIEKFTNQQATGS